MKNFKGITKNEIAIATRYMKAFIENFGDEYIIEKIHGTSTYTKMMETAMFLTLIILTQLMVGSMVAFKQKMVW